jgi:transcriptional regulator GlxA family with amidase domain
MRTSARNVAVVLFDEVELLDVAAPLQALAVAGRHWNWRPYKVLAVGRAPGRVTTRSQLTLEVEHAFDGCPAAELILVPGGYGARRALADRELVAWLAERGPAVELVGTVGWGGLLAAKAHLADGLTVALPAEATPLLEELAPEARAAGADHRLVDAGKLVSVAESGAALDLGLQLVARTLGPKLALGAAHQLGHDWTTGAGAPPPLRIEIRGSTER